LASNGEFSRILHILVVAKQLHFSTLRPTEPGGLGHYEGGHDADDSHDFGWHNSRNWFEQEIDWKFECLNNHTACAVNKALRSVLIL